MFKKKIGRRPIATKENIENIVFMEPNSGCWIWLLAMNKAGYGTIRSTLAHREVYRWFKGDFDESLDMMHLCHNPACVNPYHLRPGSRQENVQMSVDAGLWGNDMRSKIRKEYMEKRKVNGYFPGARGKLSEDQVREIRRLVDDPEARNKLADKYGVTPTAIRAISTKRVYRHVQ